jgi:hypothetical protein
MNRLPAFAFKICALLLLVLLFTGCKTKPAPSEPMEHLPLQPLTASLVAQMENNKNRDVLFGLQYYLSTRVVLNQDGGEETRGRTTREGSLELTTIRKSDTLTLERETMGEIIRISKNAEGKWYLNVCFDPDRDDLYLRFVEGDEGYFYLEKDNNRRIMNGPYQQYLLAPSQSPELPPHLLIRMRSETRSGEAAMTVRGRVLKDKQPSSIRPINMPGNSPAAGTAGTAGSVQGTRQSNENLNMLLSLQERLDQYLAGDIEMSAEELADMEQTIADLEAQLELP